MVANDSVRVTTPISNSVPISLTFNNGLRLDATSYNNSSQKIRSLCLGFSSSSKSLLGKDGLGDGYMCNRFKRILVNKSEYPIYPPSSITQICPKPDKFISSKSTTSIDNLRVKRGQILITRSGTIGKTALVSERLSNKILSDDLIRLDVNDSDYVGYVYAFLKHRFGQEQLLSNGYGAVITHIEPEHLQSVIVPIPDKKIVNQIGSLIWQSADALDEATLLLNTAYDLLQHCLGLEDFEKYDLIPQTGFSTKLSDLDKRIDGSFHNPKVNKIINDLDENGIQLVKLESLVKEIFLPNRFKRVYVDNENGFKFLGGKQLGELYPSDGKYVSKKFTDPKLAISKSMILISRSGTVGKVDFVGDRWENLVASDHIIRIIPKSEDIIGYIYIFLSSAYGKMFIKKNIFGSVIDEIDPKQIADLPIPIPSSESVLKEINKLAYDYLAKTDLAYELERKAQTILESEVIYRLTQ